MSDETLLHDCYELLADAGMPRPSWEHWHEQATSNAEVWPIRRRINGAMTLVGFVLFKGHSVHIAVTKSWQGRWITPTMLRAWRDQYSHDCDLYATPDLANKAACELAERLGFRLQRKLGPSAIYVKERTTCPQRC